MLWKASGLTRREGLAVAILASFFQIQPASAAVNVVSVSFPFHAVKTLAITGVQTAMISPISVSCADESGAPLSCAITYSPNIYNAHDSDISLDFGVTQSGLDRSEERRVGKE